LYDWFGVYKEYKQSGPEGEGGLSDEELLAQFMAGVDEMIWMGYVKRTKRKTDHVEKLVH